MSLQQQLVAELAALTEINAQLEHLLAERRRRKLRIAALESALGVSFKTELKASTAAETVAVEAKRSTKRAPPTSTSSSDSGSSSSSDDDEAAEGVTKEDSKVDAKEAAKEVTAAKVEVAASAATPAVVQGESGSVAAASAAPAKMRRGKGAVAKEPKAKKVRHFYPPGVCHVCHAAKEGWPKVHGVQHLRTCPEACSRGGARR